MNDLPSDLEATADTPAWMYVAPFGVFLVFTNLEALMPAALGGYPAGYALKVVATSVALRRCRAILRDLRPMPGPVAMTAAVVLGFVVAAAWVGLDGRYPTFGLLGTREAFDPFILRSPLDSLFIAVRMCGLVVLVPFVEELFWRSFVWRWIIDQDFHKIEIGRWSPAAATVTTLLFTASHPEWLPALLTGAAWSALLVRTRSVSACVASHIAANLGLGLYVISTHAWKFW